MVLIAWWSNSCNKTSWLASTGLRLMEACVTKPTSTSTASAAWWRMAACFEMASLDLNGLNKLVIDDNLCNKIDVGLYCLSYLVNDGSLLNMVNLNPFLLELQNLVRPTSHSWTSTCFDLRPRISHEIQVRYPFSVSKIVIVNVSKMQKDWKFSASKIVKNDTFYVFKLPKLISRKIWVGGKVLLR